MKDYHIQKERPLMEDRRKLILTSVVSGAAAMLVPHIASAATASLLPKSDVKNPPPHKQII